MEEDFQENFCEDRHVDARTARKFMDGEYAEYKTIPTELDAGK